MKSTNTELSNKLSAFISWIEYLGVVIFLSSMFLFKKNGWMMGLGLLLILSGYFYKAYLDWKTGRRKAFWRRLIVFVIAMIASGIVGYLSRDN